MNPQSLKVKGGTQPEIFQGTVDAIARELTTDPTRFWRDALATDGPIEIWEIAGERWLFNGNHRYLAAIQAGVDIPSDQIVIVGKAVSPIPTWPFHQMTTLAGQK